jgi:hypothetical protein
MADRRSEFRAAAVPDANDRTPGAETPPDSKIKPVRRVDLQQFTRYY